MLQARMLFARRALVTLCFVAFSALGSNVCVTPISEAGLDIIFPEGHLFFEAGGRGRALMVSVSEGERFARALSGPAVIIDGLPSLQRGSQTPIHLLSDPGAYSYGEGLLKERTPLVMIPQNRTFEALVASAPHPLVMGLGDAFQDTRLIARPTIVLTPWTSRDRLVHERVHVGDRAGDNPEMNRFVESLNAVHRMDHSLAPQLSAVDTLIRELRAYDAEYSGLFSSKQETIVLSGETQNVRTVDLEKIKATQRQLKAFPSQEAYVALMDREIAKMQSLVDASEGLMEAIERNRNEFGNATVSFPLYRLVHTLEIEMSVRQYAFQANEALNQVRAKNLAAYRAILEALLVVSARTEISDFQLVVLLPDHFRAVK